MAVSHLAVQVACKRLDVAGSGDEQGISPGTCRELGNACTVDCLEHGYTVGYTALPQADSWAVAAKRLAVLIACCRDPHCVLEWTEDSDRYQVSVDLGQSLGLRAVDVYIHYETGSFARLSTSFISDTCGAAAEVTPGH